MFAKNKSDRRSDVALDYGSNVHVGFVRVTAREPCPICKRTKWCQVTRDRRLVHCMVEPVGAVKRAKDGGYIHVLIDKYLDCTAARPRDPSRAASEVEHPVIERTTLAPLDIRDATYRLLLELSPAWKYERELVTAVPDGLLTRGLLAEDVSRFGALPPQVIHRDELALHINRFLEEQFAEHVRAASLAGVIGVPGFWRASSGLVKLGRDYDYKRPALIIPYRDEQGHIQACQLRFAGVKGAYHWLSTAEDKLGEEPHGTSSGCPVHWTPAGGQAVPSCNLPVFITDGALKAEVFVRLRPPMRAIASAGVGVAHAEVIRGTRGRDVLIGFDSDHRHNAQVTRQLGKLIAGRCADARAHGLAVKTSVVVWDGPKGIDEAALQNVPMHVLSACEWSKTLIDEPLAEVLDVWREFSFAPGEG